MPCEGLKFCGNRLMPREGLKFCGNRLMPREVRKYRGNRLMRAEVLIYISDDFLQARLIEQLRKAWVWAVWVLDIAQGRRPVAAVLDRAQFMVGDQVAVRPMASAPPVCTRSARR